MPRILSNKLVIEGADSNNNDVTVSIPNINPAITDTSILRAAAIQLMSLSLDSTRVIKTVQEIDITNEE